MDWMVKMIRPGSQKGFLSVDKLSVCYIMGQSTDFTILMMVFHSVTLTVTLEMLT